MNQLPAAFLERLGRIIPEEHKEAVLQSFALPKAAVYRVNTLKVSLEEVFRELELSGIGFCRPDGIPEGFILEPPAKEEVVAELSAGGRIYKQGLSSMLVPLILNPNAGESVLDMCAAPGSKTSQIAALMQNQGNLTAMDCVRARFFKLKSVLELLGVTNTQVICKDARRFQMKDDQLFDRILLDAPCSSEGRFSLLNPKTFAYWRPGKIKEMRSKQKGLLGNAARLLKPGGVLVYSTCTFAPEENEEVITWFLKKTKGDFCLEDISALPVSRYPALRQWEGKSYDAQTRKCLRVLPSEKTDHFFIAKLVRKGSPC